MLHAAYATVSYPIISRKVDLYIFLTVFSGFATSSKMINKC